MARAKRAASYNPPPNWPTPPAGWTPPPGWQPDPSWGPPPVGWELWKQPKGYTGRNVLIGFAVAIVVIVVAAAAAGSTKKKTASTAGSSTQSASPTASPAQQTSTQSATTPSTAATTSTAASSQAAAVSTPAAAVSTPAPSVAAAAPVPAPVSYAGTGTKVITIAKPTTGAVLAFVSNTGQANFIVTPLDANLQPGQTLVNAIGNYQAVELLDADGSETHTLHVESDGAWTIKLAPLADAQTLVPHGTISGNGDDVLIYRGDPAVATMKFNGQGNFIVDADTSDGFPDNLANEIGPWNGQSPLPKGPLVIVIQASGDLSSVNSPWSITLG